MYNIVNTIRSLRCVFSLFIPPDADGLVFKTPNPNCRDTGRIGSVNNGVCYSTFLLLLLAFAIQTIPAQQRETVKASKGRPEATKKTQTSPCGGAKRILLATTSEDVQGIHPNLRSEFTNNAPAGSTVVSNNTELTNGVAPPAGFFSGYDVVVIGSVFQTMDSMDFTALQTAILNKESNAFVFFTDFCSSCSSTNRTLMTNLLNAVKNSSIGAISIAVNQGPSGGATPFVLNTASPYSVSFGGLSQFYGNDYRPFNGIPANNKLYLNHSGPPTGLPDETYAMVLPLVNSLGAGVFVTADGSWADNFGRYPLNKNKVAPAFYAATSSGGSMFVGTQEVDLSLAASVSPPSPAVGGTVTYTFTVTNNSSTVPATNVKVSDFLPTSDLSIVSTSGACSNPSPASPTCTIASIGPGASATYTLTATVKPGTVPRSITATSVVNAGTTQVDPANCNNAATTTVSVTAGQSNNACCPPWNSDTLSHMMAYVGTGPISAPYSLRYQPTSAFNNQMQAYINYVQSLNSAFNTITIDFGLHDQGTGATPIALLNPLLLPPPATSSGKAVWTAGGVPAPSITPAGLFTTNQLMVGTWYRVHTEIHLQPGQTFFDDKCVFNDINVRVQVMNAKAAGGRQAVLEFSDGKKVIMTVPISKGKQ